MSLTNGPLTRTRPKVGQPWVFQHIAGPRADRKTITLSGYAAPFGRPRQKPVVSEELSIRHSATRYPGYEGPPTRHFFGSQWGDSVTVLAGRWTDRDLGADGTEHLVRDFQNFVKAQRKCTIAWSDIVTFVGFIERIVIHRESATEVTWELHCLIDEREFFELVEAPLALPPTVAATTGEIDSLSKDGLGSIMRRLPSLDAVTGELVDQVDDLVAGMNQSAALVVRLGNSINNLSEATFNELERLRAGSRQFRTALNKLSDTVDSIGDESLLFARQAEDDLKWLVFHTQEHVRRFRVLASLADLDDDLDAVSASGPAGRSYIARGGDSWESISTQFFGGPGNADAIRGANGIRYTEAPVAGRTYQIPANA